MKKLAILLVSLSLFTGCNNEPLEGDFSGITGTGTGTGTGGAGTGSTDLSLASYSFDLNSTVPFLGEFIVNTDFIINTNNNISSIDLESVLFGTTFTALGTVTRNNSGQVITIKNFDGSNQTNQTNITYTANVISQIEFDDFLDDTEDYVYNFTNGANSITRTTVGSADTVVYTTDGIGRLLIKESFTAGTSVQIETLSYNGNGNCTAVTITNSTSETTNYGFDTFTNPLATTFSDQYWLSILDDDAEESAGALVVQFYSTNNWNSITTSSEQVNFIMQYDSADRITSRDATYDLDGSQLVQSESFNYAN